MSLTLRALEDRFAKHEVELIVDQDVQSLLNHLEAANDYPYALDFEFSHLETENFYCYRLLHKGESIATYAVKQVEWHELKNRIQNYLSHHQGHWDFEGSFPGTVYYSSCQYVVTPWRGRGLGVWLDHYKKFHSYQQFTWDWQLSHCKSTLHHYHLNSLKYSQSQKGFSVDGMPGSGEEGTTQYFINWQRPEDLEVIGSLYLS